MTEPAPPTDIYLAPLDTPPVDSVTDESGHLLRIPDGYRWVGVLWQPDPDRDDTRAWVSAYPRVWATVQVRRPATFTDVTEESDPFDAGGAHRYFRLLAVTRTEILDQLVWDVRWLPRARADHVQGGLLTITGERDLGVGAVSRQFLAGPGMTDTGVRAALGLEPGRSA